jgi:pyruvate dehydrogenase E2 component (dihydrolipoamide acetyltransferase)
MAIVITMPKLSDTMTDGQFICWRKNLGERVERGDILAEVETDKAVMELEAFSSGFLIKTMAKAGEIVPVGTVLGLLGEAEDMPDPAETASGPVEAESAAEAEPERALSPAGRAVPGHETSEHEKASPIVRRMAREQGINLAHLQGSGPDGRITQDDLQLYIVSRQSIPELADAVDTAAAALKKESATGADGPSAMRKAITTTVSRSWREIPHFNVTTEINMDVCREIVSEMKEVRHGIGYNALIIKACAAALEKFPLLHTADRTTGNGISISYAVSLPDGLLMPVIRECQRLSVDEIGYEASRLTDKSRSGHLSAEEMSGGGFSVSNLGMYGVDEFFALILPGQTAILAVGAVADRAVVRDGQLVVAPTMRVTLSCDHRVIDGAYAASFLAELRRTLEQPLLLLL